MMGRLSHEQAQFFYSFRLDEAVPDDHPVREIAADDPDAYRRLRVCDPIGASAVPRCESEPCLSLVLWALD